MKAIETRYAGCRFRSRLEARWAVFFDALGIAWDYEPEGLLVGPDERPYLPDFRITSVSKLTMLVEVKGTDETLDVDKLAGATGDDAKRDQLMILGPIPRVDEGVTPTHWMIRRIAGRAYLAEGYFTPLGNVMQFGYEYPVAPRTLEVLGGLVEGRMCEDLVLRPEVERAYIAARSARFEHGESGAPAAGTDRGAAVRAEQMIAEGKRELLPGGNDLEKVSLHWLRENWRTVVGEELGAHTEPTDLADGELVISADSSAWRVQAQLLAKQIVERLPDYLGPRCPVRAVKAIARRRS